MNSKIKTKSKQAEGYNEIHHHAVDHDKRACELVMSEEIDHPLYFLQRRGERYFAVVSLCSSDELPEFIDNFDIPNHGDGEDASA